MIRHHWCKAWPSGTARASVPPMLFLQSRPACKCRGSADRASLPQFSPWASMRPRFPSLRPFPAWRREGIPFEVYLVSADLRRWLSVAGILAGRGGPLRASASGHLSAAARIPCGGGPSPIRHLGHIWTAAPSPFRFGQQRFYPAPIPGLAYTITYHGWSDGICNRSPCRTQSACRWFARSMQCRWCGGRYVVFGFPRRRADIRQLADCAIEFRLRPQAVAVTVTPVTPTLEYFQAHLTPYGNGLTCRGLGGMDSSRGRQTSLWQPYMDAGPLGITRRRMVHGNPTIRGAILPSIRALDPKRADGWPMGLGAGL